MNWRRTLFAALKALVVAATAFFVGRALVVHWPQLRAGWRAPTAWPLAATCLTLLASYLCLYAVSLAILRRLGYRLRFRAGLKPFFYTLLGRYIPGRVAVIAGKIYMYEKRGVKRVYAALAPAYENVFAAVGGVAVSLAAAAALFSSRFMWWQLAPAAAGAAALAVFVQPPVLTRLLKWPMRAFRGGELGPTALIRTRGAAAFAGGYAGYCLLLGASFSFLAASFLPLDAGTAARAGAAYVVAAVLGYVVVFAPSGLGVREGLLLLLLKPYMTTGDAAFLAVLSRVMAVAAEVLFAAAAAAIGTNEPASPTVAECEKPERDENARL